MRVLGGALERSLSEVQEGQRAPLVIVIMMALIKIRVMIMMMMLIFKVAIVYLIDENDYDDNGEATMRVVQESISLRNWAFYLL